MSALSDVIEIDKITGRLSCFDQSPNMGLSLKLWSPAKAYLHMATCFEIVFHKVMASSSRGHGKVKAAESG